ncbi:MAG: hypothetical protein QM809_01420 [Gordonia sp. (in: high G+C Gram-positive bacteria)]|uniref:hypothetical protein n=1 Tax=Gordonia sp. (in: high G+C Gram-positive bacteria) TaxID=84139 RepID=UPI0039E2534D
MESLGFGAREIRRRLRVGDLITVRRGWYAAPRHDPDVVAAVRAGGVLSCVSALARYGFWVPPGYTGDHARIGRGVASKSRACRGFSETAAGTLGVDPMTVALECAARCMRPEDWIATCDSVQNSLGRSAAEIRGAMGHLPEHVLALFDKTDARAQSGTESLCRVRLRALRYKVVVQPQIPEVGRADLRIGRLIIECDGRRYHSDEAAYRNDRIRDRRATVGKWLTFRVTLDDVIYPCGWNEVVEDIRAITAADRHRFRAEEPSRRPPR